MAGIARKHGFHDFRTIWNHPQNAKLKSLRKNPNILFPGDLVFIPDMEQRIEEKVVDAKHIFIASKPLLVLRITIRDTDDLPVRDTQYLLLLKAGSSLRKTDGDGSLEPHVINEDETAGQLTLAARRMDFRLQIGHLNPLIANPQAEKDAELRAEAITAWQDRLNNIGYFAGFTPKDEAQLRWAIEEFQREHGWIPEKGKKPNGKTDQETRDALEKAFGC
jgi:N-acetylmuramoyl-L-alanine amidase